MSPQHIAIQIAALFFSITIHEAAHAWTANRCGDPTALMLGRVTLNPIAHVDMFGTVLVPALLLFTGSPVVFGWAKPVPVNPRNFGNYRRDEILVSGAGIAANLICVLVAGILFHVVLFAGLGGGNLVLGFMMILANLIVINSVLAVFNLIPIPPLDGSHILQMLLPPEMGMRFEAIKPYGMVLLILLMFTGAVNWVLSGIAMPLARLALGGYTGYFFG